MSPGLRLDCCVEVGSSALVMPMVPAYPTAKGSQLGRTSRGDSVRTDRRWFRARGRISHRDAMHLSFPPEDVLTCSPRFGMVPTMASAAVNRAARSSRARTKGLRGLYPPSSMRVSGQMSRTSKTSRTPSALQPEPVEDGQQRRARDDHHVGPGQRAPAETKQLPLEVQPSTDAPQRLGLRLHRAQPAK